MSAEFIYDIYDGYNAAKPFLRTSYEVVEKFIIDNSRWLPSEPAKLYDCIADYVGSQELYEEGCEEEW